MLICQGHRRAPVKVFIQSARSWFKEKGMRAIDAIRVKEGEVQRLLETNGFIEPNLSGSAARGDDHEGSDLYLHARR